MNYPNSSLDLETIGRYIDLLKDAIDAEKVNLGLVSSIARTTAHLADAMMANQTLNPGY